MRVVSVEPSFLSWRSAARALLVDRVPPHAVVWHAGASAQGSLLPADALASATDGAPRAAAAPRVSRAFMELAQAVACHGDDSRWDALYRVLFRLSFGEPALLEVATDPDVHRVMGMARSVKRAVHKMHAFVRFRAVESGGGTRYVAWFEPAHPVVQRAAPLFARRFASMRWSILTPGECVHWDGEALRFTPGVGRDRAPSEDELEELWRSYYAHIFNPARLSLDAMQAEMPKSYWANLPEARLIPSLTREAPARVARMLAQAAASPADIPHELRATCVEVPYSPAAVSVPQPVPVPVPVHGVPVRVGTASWTDPTLLAPGVFYPSHVVTPEDRLRFYASRFPIVEVDATYYVPPTRAMSAAWATRTPAGFVFDIKAYALMTGHGAETKRMPEWLRRQLPRSLASEQRVYAKDLPTAVMDDVWERFQHALEPLREAGKLGPVLLQFPRWFTPSRDSADTLRAARMRLGSAPAAVEFRNPAWVTGRVAARTLALLEQLELTYVIVDAPPGTASSMPPVTPVTTPGLSVVRLHGRRRETWEATNPVVSERYRYLYDAAELREWVGRLDTITERLAEAGQFPDMAHARQGVHVVFNNCHANYGTNNAAEITALLIEFDRERAAAGSATATA